MQINRIAAFLSMIGAIVPVSASAQTVGDDVRCVLLSNLVARGIKDASAKSMAQESVSFYLGRLDSQASDAAITSAMQSIPPSLNANAGKDMEACMARVRQAKLRIQALGSAVQGRRGK